MKLWKIRLRAQALRRIARELRAAGYADVADRIEAAADMLP